MRIIASARSLARGDRQGEQTYCCMNPPQKSFQGKSFQLGIKRKRLPHRASDDKDTRPPGRDATPSEKKRNYGMRWSNTPPLISPLVLIAQRLSVVVTQTVDDIPMIPLLCRMPACATTHESRRNSITPHMFSRHGMKTPWIHPNLILWSFCLSSTFSTSSCWLSTI